MGNPGLRTRAMICKPLSDIYQYLNKRDEAFEYEYFGTKINSLDPHKTQKVNGHKVIFMMRDVKSWLIKESIIKIYRTDLDVVVPATEYLKYIVKTSKYTHTYRLWMEDLIEKNDEVIANLSEYLDISLTPYTDKWWKIITNWDTDDPKSAFRLGHVHHSSKVKPKRLDTIFELKNNPFWDDVDEIQS